MTKKLDTLIEEVLEEYFALTGPSLPTVNNVSYQDIGPFSQYVRSAADILDRILDIVNDDVADLDKLDVQEFLYNSVPRLQNKIDTLCDAIERKTGLKRKSKTRANPLVPPKLRVKKTKIK